MNNTQHITLTAKGFTDALTGGYKGIKAEDEKGYWEDAWGNIVFENIELKDDVSISKCNLPFITLNNSITNNLNFDNLKVGGFDIRNSKIVSLGFESTNIESRIDLNNDTYVGILNIGKLSTVGGELTVQNSKVNDIHLNAKELRRVSFSDSNCFNFFFSQDSFCNLKILGCEIGFLSVSNSIIPKDSIFLIANSSIGSLLLQKFINTGWLHLVNITSSKHSLGFFSLENSDLGKTNLINCDLDSFGHFVFYNTKMLDVFVAGTELPKKSDKFKLPSSKNNKEKDAQQRLAYGQFKKISDNRGDSVQATEFLALEMDAYARELANQKGKRDERINLWLNKFSSNWGNDWVRSVLITLIINSFCFLLYCLSLGYTLGTNWEIFWKLASYCLEFLNPLRKSDFLQADITPLARVVDYASRIIVAYFTYQTIQAFRRFGKR
jgi:hypothetical protein